MALEQTPTNFMNPESLSIDPKWNLVSAGNIDIKPPPLESETDEPYMPAVIGKPLGAAGKKRQFYKKGPGGTLAEQVGSDVVDSQAIQEPQEAEIIQPINVPASHRVVPTVSTPMPDMSTVLTPQALRAEVPNPPAQPETGPALEPEVPRANLKEFVLKYIQAKGIKDSCEFFGKAEGTINSWVNGRQDPPLSAVQKLIDSRPKSRENFLKVAEEVMINWETGEGSFQRDHTREDLPVDLCLAVKGDIPPYIHWVFATAAAQYGLGSKMMTDTIIIRSRNMIADLFLKGKATWALWLDADILPTTGNALWWRSIVRDNNTVSDTTASYDFIKRLLSHKQPFVGGCYATRRKNGPLVNQPDLHPRGAMDKAASNSMRQNKAKGLLEVDWLSIGFCIVHRTVFETVRKNNPQLASATPGEPFPFFTPKGNVGEDVAFSLLARSSGFKLYLDQELFGAHIGRYAFLPSESQFNGVLDFTNA